MIYSGGQNLIFIISQPRAGSTLLQRILAGNRDVVTTAEPWIALHPLYALKNSGVTAEYDSGLALMALDDFCENLSEGKRTYMAAVRDMLISLYNDVITQNGGGIATRFLDKTPRYYHIARGLMGAFPEAKFILLARSPLAVLASILETWVKDDPSNLANYRDDLLRAPGLLSVNLSRFTVVSHYENLVADPDTEVRRICAKIGLEYSPAMLQYGDRPAPKGRMGDPVGVAKHASPQFNFDKWPMILSEPHRWLLANAYVARLSGNVCASLGYPKKQLREDLDRIKPAVLPEFSKFTL
jgi:hypothetical protein